MLGDIVSAHEQLTIADMEAGLEHLSRSDGTLRHVDVLLVVVEPYRKALETARRTLRLARELGIPAVHGVASKVEGPEDAERVEAFAAEVGLELLDSIPYDDAVRRADRDGRALLDVAPDAPAVRAIERLLDALERVMGGAPVAA